MKRRITVVRSGIPTPAAAADAVIADEELRREIRSGRFVRRLASARESRLLVHRLGASGRPLATAAALWAMSPGAASIEDASGARRPVTLTLLANWIARLALEPLQTRGALSAIAADLARCEAVAAARRLPRLDLDAPPLYLRTDLSFGIRAGGSVGHTAGVLNNLSAFGAPPIFVTTDDVPTVDRGIETHVVMPSDAFWNFRELPALLLTQPFAAETLRVVDRRSIGFVYQRYSLGNYSGVVVSRALGVPLILEYNGSEVWVSDHWGRPLKHRELALRIERLNHLAADLIVVVSDPIADQLTAAGIPRERVLVNPNAVDVERYRPDIDGALVRRTLGLDRAFVVGFIGTFGAWHGAEVLAEAFVTLMRERPELRRSMRLLMAGNGARMPLVRRILDAGGVADLVRLPGLVSQEDGPSYLAACDLLVSPHVPNADGTPFFGSPTKLFEYMAMGRPIVASNLNQIGEVLEHDRTAWLVAPGDASALADAIAEVAANEAQRRRLGAAARTRAVARHTWREHTQRIIDRVRALDRAATSVATAPATR